MSFRMERLLALRLSLTLAEQDCHFRMNDDHPSARVQESTSHMLRSQYDVVRAEWLGLLFRDKTSQPY